MRLSRIGFFGLLGGGVVLLAVVSLFALGVGAAEASVAEVRAVLDGIPAADKTLTLLAGIGHEPLLVACPERWRTAVRKFLEQYRDR